MNRYPEVMWCEPILTTGPDDVLDVREMDNLLVETVGISEGEFHSRGEDIAVITLELSGERYIGEPRSRTQTLVDNTSVMVMLPVPLVKVMGAMVNDAIKYSDKRQKR